MIPEPDPIDPEAEEGEAQSDVVERTGGAPPPPPPKPTKP